MRIANTVKLNLSKLEFKNPNDKKLFLRTLDRTYITWVKAMIARVEKGFGRNEILTIDLNDPPFTKDLHFMENAERLVGTLAMSTNADIRRAAVRCTYTDRQTLGALLEDEEADVREVAQKRLSGLSNM